MRLSGSIAMVALGSLAARSISAQHTMFSTHNAATSCAIDDLPPNAALEHVTVAAVNEVGESPRCVELACVRPLEAAVPQLHLVATRPGEVEVEWQLPSDAPSQPSPAPRSDSRTSGGGSSSTAGGFMNDNSEGLTEFSDSLAGSDGM